jgi:hypothetical protein
MKRRVASLSLAASVAVALMLILAAPGLAAGPTRLNQGTVTPTMGDTSTVFAYSVHYVGDTTGETAISVRVEASNGSTTRTTPLSLTAGAPLNGTWTGSSTLPAGSWTITFKAISSLGVNPQLIYATAIVVTAPPPPPTPTPVPPPPTPQPTPRPTVRPTPRPTGVPATPTPIPGSSVAPGPTPFGTTITEPSGTPRDSSAAESSGEASPTPSSSPAGAGSPARRPFSVPVEGVVAIGLLGAVAVAAGLGERRRRRAVAAFRAGLASSDEPWAAAADAEDSAAGADEVDDETVATIDYEGLDEGPDEWR